MTCAVVAFKIFLGFAVNLVPSQVAEPTWYGTSRWHALVFGSEPCEKRLVSVCANHSLFRPDNLSLFRCPSGEVLSPLRIIGVDRADMRPSTTFFQRI